MLHVARRTVDTLSEIARELQWAALVLILLSVPHASLGAPSGEHRMQLVTSSSRPRLKLGIDTSFFAVPPLSFHLKYTDLERRIFVEADRARFVRRLIVVQFEKVRSGAHFNFVYPPKPPMNFGAETYRFGAYVYNDAKAAASQPGMEAARTRSALEARGYRLRLLRTARLARVTDRLGQSEIIIFYNENADETYPSGTLPNADADGDLVLDRIASKSLFENLKAVIHPIDD
jgi:hypothetical protein